MNPAAKAFFLSALALCAGLQCARVDRLAFTQLPGRGAWQLPDRVIAALEIQEGDHVADLGSGTGYFTIPLARAVGPRGRVYAVDVDQAALDEVMKKAEQAGLQNVRPVLAGAENPGLPAKIDLVFSCNSYHHLPDRIQYMSRLRNSLQREHRIAIVDHFHELRGVLRLFLSNGHWTPPLLLDREMKAAGYEPMAQFDFLATQHFTVFRPAQAR